MLQTPGLPGGMVNKIATTDWHREPYNDWTFALPEGYKRIMDISQISYSKMTKDRSTTCSKTSALPRGQRQWWAAKSISHRQIVEQCLNHQ